MRGVFGDLSLIGRITARVPLHFVQQAGHFVQKGVGDMCKCGHIDVTLQKQWFYLMT